MCNVFFISALLVIGKVVYMPHAVIGLLSRSFHADLFQEAVKLIRWKRTKITAVWHKNKDIKWIYILILHENVK